MRTFRYWLRGIRFYIAVGTVLLTALIIWWAHAAYAGTTLYPTRIEEVFAWLATGLLGLALSIGPTYKLLPHLKGKSIFFDARRLIGVSAAWFAALHVGIAYISLFHDVNPRALPKDYQVSFLLGVIALIIMLAMMFTSFDKAFKGMGIWWFRLHRLVYPAVGLVLLHAFIIGVHATQLIPLILLTLVTVCIATEYVVISFVRVAPTKWQAVTITCMSIFLAAVLTYGFAQQLNHGGGSHS